MAKLVLADAAIRELETRSFAHPREVTAAELLTLASAWNSEARSHEGKERMVRYERALYCCEEAHRRDRSDLSVVPVAREAMDALGEKYSRSKYRALSKVVYPPRPTVKKSSPREVVAYVRPGREPIFLEKFKASGAVGLLSPAEVMDILDRLPGGLFRSVPLRRITFISRPSCLVLDGTELSVVGLRRAKGAMVQRLRTSTRHDSRDGTERIDLYATRNWDERGDDALDRSEAGAGLCLAIGSLLVNSIQYGDRLARMQSWGRLRLPYAMSELARSKPVLEEWKTLPECTHPAFQQARDIAAVVHQHQKPYPYSVAKEETLSDLQMQYDIVLAFRHLVWDGDLEAIDPGRYALVSDLLEQLK